MTIKVLPKTNVTGGLRYTSDRRAFDGGVSAGDIDSGPFIAHTSYGNLTDRIAVDYSITSDALVYAAYNRGFKSGVYNLTSLTAASKAAPLAAAPENLDAYTAGFKTEFFNHHVRFNAEGFFYNYKNIQVINNILGGSILTNAGAAHIKGVDAELTWEPFRRLTVTESLSITEGHYTAFPGGLQFFLTGINPRAPLPIPAGCAATVATYPTSALPEASRSCDLTDRKTVLTVPVASSLSASYLVPTPFGDLAFDAAWAHGGDYYFEVDNNPFSRQPVTDIIDTSVTWTPSNDRFSVRLWGHNITGEKYYAFDNQSTVAGVKYAPAPPATYGVAFGLHL
jgi:iron complex outermembrane receptor protein